jgi:DNA-binding CsgD family transcriptional regulator
MRQVLEEWDKKPKIYLTREELAVCKNNPAQALKIRGPELVPCCECGLVERKLDGHLRGQHYMATPAYKSKWPGAEVLCRSLKEEYVDQLKLAWARPRQLRRKPAQRLRGKARPGQQTIPETRLAELTLEGNTFAEMAAALGISPNKARAKSLLLERLGFPRRGGALGGYLFEHGKPVTGRYIQDLLEDFAIGPTSLGRDLRIRHGKVLLSKWVREFADRPLRANTARRFIKYRHERYADLVIPTDPRAAGIEKAGAIRGQRRARYLLGSEVRAIPEHCAVLHPLFSELRDHLRREKITEEGILAWICERSRMETAQKPEGPAHYRRLLFWWLALRAWLKMNRGVLLNLHPNAAVYDFLGFDYGTSRLSIQACREGNLEPIDPALAREKAGVGRKKCGPRGPSKDPHDKTYFEVGREVDEATPGFQRFIEFRRSLPRARRENRSRLEGELAKAGFSQAQIDAAVSAKDASTAARQFIAAQRRMSFSAVKRYHITYLASRQGGPAQ